MPEWTPSEFERALDDVARRSRTDADFRKLALKDASAAIEKVSGKPLPAGADFQFVDNSGTKKIYPLPDPLANITCQEATMEELEQVAGGGIPGTIQGGITWSR
jgi:hypothetical protein